MRLSPLAAPPQPAPLAREPRQLAFAGNGRNRLREAVCLATGIRPSNALRRDAVTRTGNGRIQLQGPYTGDSDRAIEVQIVGGAGEPSMSTPVFRGVGSGSVQDLEVLPAAQSAEYRLTLVSLGTRTQAAELDLGGYRVVAAQTGAAGNLISLTVDESALVATATDYSLIEDIPAGAERLSGAGRDWDSAAGIGDAVPAGAGRYCIGADRSVVYRQWRSFADGAWVYRLLPAAARLYRAGERVWTISGGRSITISDGTTAETYPGIVTLRDLLAAIKASSTLLTVPSLPGEGQTADNLAAVADLRLRTAARIDDTTGAGSGFAQGFTDTWAGANAATEILTAACYASSAGQGAGLGRTKWLLRGSVSGDLGTMQEGVAWTHPLGRCGATIPPRLPDGYGEARGTLGAEVSYASRADGEVKPPICVEALRTGPDAKDGEWTWVYTQRPAADCPCEDQSWTRLPGGEACLNSEEEAMSGLGASFAARVEAVERWYRDFCAANTQVDATGGRVEAAHLDLRLAGQIRALLLDTLTKLYSQGKLSWAARAANTYVAQDTVVEPATRNGYRYRAYHPGTTGSTTPTYPTTPGTTFGDGGVTWICAGKTPEGEADDLLALVDTDLTVLKLLRNPATLAALPLWTPSTAYTVDTVVRGRYYEAEYDNAVYTLTDRGAYNNHIYKCVAAGTSNAAPTSARVSSHVPPKIVESNQYGTSYNTAYDPSAIGYPFSEPGLSGKPMWVYLGGSLGSGDINAEAYPSRSTSAKLEDFLARYQARAGVVLAAAEVAPNFDDTSAQGAAGGGCWSDPGDAYWWVPAGDKSGYAPAFTNREYISVKWAADGSKTVLPTREFGFAIVVNEGCISHLKDGDTVTIRIGDAGWDATYRTGDQLTMTVIAAAPLAFVGGQDGDDTLTWSVARSGLATPIPYAQDLAAPALFDDGWVRFRLGGGGVPNALGDTWSWCLTDAGWRWRDHPSGAWSTPFDLSDLTGTLPDGLSLAFDPGACPSWLDGDQATWTALQPHGPASALSPDDAALAWEGDGVTLTYPLTGAVDLILLGLHSLPSSALVRVQADGLDQSLPWRPGLMALPLAAPLHSPTLTISITQAEGGRVGWLWAGEAVRAAHDPTQTRTRHWSQSSGAGLNPRGYPLGTGWSTQLGWVLLRSPGLAELLGLIEAAKAAGNEPLALVPVTAPDEAMLVRVGDQIDLPDYFEYQEPPNKRILHNIGLDLNPYYG